MATRYQMMTAEQKKLANARNRRWKDKNRDRVLLYKRKHYQENKAKFYALERDRQYKKRYGISLQDYNDMYAAQGGLCLICGDDKSGKIGQCFAVDHCHISGEVRGLLCIKCNSSLGWFEKHKDSIAKYLRGR